jgi:hypothetical protein
MPTPGRKVSVRANDFRRPGQRRLAEERRLHLRRPGSSGHALIATSHAKSRLTTDGWPLIGSEQLAEHPFYAVTRPGGYSFCSIVNVTFTPDTPDPEMRRLITFDLSCITRLRACRYLEDIYPAAENWHLLDRPSPPNRSTPRRPRSPLPAVYLSLPEVAKRARF